MGLGWGIEDYGLERTDGRSFIYIGSSDYVYALEWEEDEYRLYVDDQLYFTFKNEGTGYEVWPYDKRFHILLNLAIGGNWGGQKGIDDSLFPHVFEIDYVRVYKK